MRTVSESARATQWPCAVAADALLMAVLYDWNETVDYQRAYNESYLLYIQDEDELTRRPSSTSCLAIRVGVKRVATRCLIIPIFSVQWKSLPAARTSAGVWRRSQTDVRAFLFSSCEPLGPCFMYVVSVSFGQRVCLNARKNSSGTELFSDIFRP